MNAQVQIPIPSKWKGYSISEVTWKLEAKPKLIKCSPESSKIPFKKLKSP